MVKSNTQRSSGSVILWMVFFLLTGCMAMLVLTAKRSVAHKPVHAPPPIYEEQASRLDPGQMIMKNSEIDDYETRYSDVRSKKEAR